MAKSKISVSSLLDRLYGLFKPQHDEPEWLSDVPAVVEHILNRPDGIRQRA